MTAESEFLLAGFCVPNLDCVILAAADDPFAITAEAHVLDRACMSTECKMLLAGICVPDPDRLIFAATDNSFAIVAEAYASN